MSKMVLPVISETKLIEIFCLSTKLFTYLRATTIVFYKKNLPYRGGSGVYIAVFWRAEYIFEVSRPPRGLLGPQHPKMSAFSLEMRAPDYLGN